MADPHDTHTQFMPVEIDQTLMDVYVVDEHGKPMKGRPVLKVRLRKRSRTIKKLKLRWEPTPSESDERRSASSDASI